MNAFNAVLRMVTIGALIGIASSAVAQQDYPNKPIRFITPYVPGGSTTVVARVIGQKLTESWGQQVIIENRPGGNTIIGTEVVTKSKPDGYTILLAGSTLAVNPSLFPTPYDPIKDLALVATVASYENVLVVHPSVPANNLQELIALAKSRPGQINYATSSAGGSAHLGAELLNTVAGIKTQHIPYKGGGQAVTDLIAGQVQMMISVPTNVVGHIKNGRLRALAVSGEKRMSALPQVPTFSEAGLPGIVLKTWQGVAAPAGTPMAIIQKMSSEIAKIVFLPDVKEMLEKQGFDPFISTPEQCAALLKADMARYAKIIKDANIKAE